MRCLFMQIAKMGNGAKRCTETAAIITSHSIKTKVTGYIIHQTEEADKKRPVRLEHLTGIFIEKNIMQEFSLVFLFPRNGAGK